MLRHFNIGQRLTLTLWSAALTAFVVAAIGMVLFKNLTLEPRVRQIVEPYADLVNAGADAAVKFDDSRRAAEILATLRANPQIVEAELFLEDGTLLARYSKQTNAPATTPKLKPDGIHFGQNMAEFIQTLPNGAHLRIVMSLDQLRRFSDLTLFTFGGGLAVLMAITLGLLSALRRNIVRPISTLAAAAQQVRTHADYSQRVPASGTDEVAQLGRSFNAMMEAIQEREVDLRQLSRFQRTILDNAAYPIISTTPDGKITSFNPAAERLLGYTASEVMWLKTPELWHDRAELQQRAKVLSKELGRTVAPGFELFAAHAPDRSCDEGEWTFIRKDGSRVPVFLSITALRNEKSEIMGFVGLVYDLTERQHAREALEKMNQELEQRVVQRTADLQSKSAELRDSQRALMNIIEDLNEKTVAVEAVNKELEAFSYSVSHDLRAPLRSIDGFCRILLEETAKRLDEEGKENLQRVRRASQRMGQLIDDMLTLSRITRTELHRQPVNLSHIANEIADELRKSDPARQVEFRIEPGMYAQGDPQLLRIILDNLFGNAWKFTSREPKATVEFGKAQVNGDQVFFVRDNGVGFDMAYSHKLFGAFQRLHSVNDFPGTGVGLATVQRVINRHGGRIWAQSQVGHGATFYFSLSQLSKADK